EQLLVFLTKLQRLATLRRHQLALDRRDLALGTLNGLDLLLDLLDHPALHQFGELDLANALRQLDARLEELPAGAAVLTLVLLRDGRQLLLGLLEGGGGLLD